MVIQIIKEWSGVVVLVLLVVSIGFWAGTSWSKTMMKIAILETQVQEDRQAITQIANIIQQAKVVNQKQ